MYDRLGFSPVYLIWAVFSLEMADDIVAPKHQWMSEPGFASFDPRSIYVYKYFIKLSVSNQELLKGQYIFLNRQIFVLSYVACLGLMNEVSRRLPTADFKHWIMNILVIKSQI